MIPRNVYDLSSEAELDKILSSIHISSDLKPSVVLAQIKSAIGGGSNALIKRLWLKRLPIKIQDALELNEDATLAQMATNTDRLHEKSVAAVVLDAMLDTVKNLSIFHKAY